MSADPEFLSFIAQALRLFGPSCRVRLEAAGQIGTFKFPADPAWRPPVIKVSNTRNAAHDSNKRRIKHGKG